MDDLTITELTRVIKNYINDNYSYDYADIWEDELSYHYDNEKKNIVITVNIDYIKEDED